MSLHKLLYGISLILILQFKGLPSDLPSPQNLQDVMVPVVGNTLCGCYYDGDVVNITENMICAGAEGSDACNVHSQGRGRYMQLNTASRIMRLYADPEACLKENFRMHRTTIHHLLQTIASPRDHGWGQEMELLVFLYYLAHALSLNVVCNAFDIPKSTVHNMVHRITREMKVHISTIICFPPPHELAAIAAGFSELAYSPVFSTVVGAIDGCHIRVQCPGDEKRDDYSNYKLFTSVQMQGLCDHRGKFLDLFTGYPGSVNDARILRNSPLFHQALYPPAGYCILGDGAYPCLERPIRLMTPYKRPLRNRVEERYNIAHSRARNIIERAFGMMKQRWRATLSKALEINILIVPDIVCCAMLHNICLQMNDELDEELENDDSDEDQVPDDPPIGGPEHDGFHIRDRIAAQLSAPVQLPQQLHEHDYL